MSEGSGSRSADQRPGLAASRLLALDGVGTEQVVGLLGEVLSRLVAVHLAEQDLLRRVADGLLDLVDPDLGLERLARRQELPHRHEVRLVAIRRDVLDVVTRGEIADRRNVLGKGSARVEAFQQLEDRKSTRLNSSHVEIS